jgi:hypothetical protein
MSDFKQDFDVEDGELKEELAMIEHQERNNSNASENFSSCDSKAITNNPMKFMMTY